MKTRATSIRTKFRYVLVDEYQDVNYRAVPAGRAARRQTQEPHGRRRRRSVDLFVARQRLSHDPALRRGLSGREGLQARRELSLDADDPRPRPTSWSPTTRRARPRSCSRTAPRARQITRSMPQRPSVTKRATSSRRSNSTSATARPIETSSCSTAPTPNRASSKKRCIAEGIPYRVVGGVGFYARTEIKDMLAYLRYIVNPADARGIPAHRQRAAPRRSANRRWPRCSKPRTPRAFRSAKRSSIANCSSGPFPRKQRELERFAELIRDFRETGRGRERSPICSSRVMEESGYVRELQADDTHEGARARRESARADRRRARVRRRRCRSGHALEDFLTNIALVSDLDTLDPGYVVTSR